MSFPQKKTQRGKPPLSEDPDAAESLIYGPQDLLQDLSFSPHIQPSVFIPRQSNQEQKTLTPYLYQPSISFKTTPNECLSHNNLIFLKDPTQETSSEARDRRITYDEPNPRCIGETNPITFKAINLQTEERKYNPQTEILTALNQSHVKLNFDIVTPNFISSTTKAFKLSIKPPHNRKAFETTGQIKDRRTGNHLNNDNGNYTDLDVNHQRVSFKPVKSRNLHRISLRYHPNSLKNQRGKRGQKNRE